MASTDTAAPESPQTSSDDELSSEELEQVSGGQGDYPYPTSEPDDPWANR